MHFSSCVRSGQKVLMLSVLSLCSLIAATTFARDRPPKMLEVAKSKHAAITNHIEWLEESGDPTQALEFDKKLVRIVDCYEGRAQLPAEPESSLHVVSVYSGLEDTNQIAKVRVTVTDHPIVLAVCGYEPVWWTIEADPGVRIEKIIVGGYHTQSIENKPSGVPVESYVHDDGSELYFYSHGRDAAGWHEAMQKLERIAGQKPRTFQGQSRYRDEILVGPDSASWRLQRVLPELDALYRLAIFESPTMMQALESLRFHGIFRRQTQPRRPAKQWVGTFDRRGPVRKSLQAVEPDLTHVVVDPKTSVAYGVTHHDLYTLDLSTGATELLELEERKDLPRFSWTAGVAFDTKRRRLLVLTSHVYARLYAYDVDQQRWSLLQSMRGTSYGGLIYLADQDELCLTVREGGAQRCVAVERRTPEGEFLTQKPLTEPIPSSDRRALGRTQIAQINEERLLVIPGLLTAVESGGPKFVQRAYVVNHETGMVEWSFVQETQDE